MSFSISPGTSLEALQQAMGKPGALPLQQEIEQRPAMKRARAKGRFRADDPATTENEAWEPES